MFDGYQVVLIINHTEQKCGVYQYGHNTASILRGSDKYYFKEINCHNDTQILEAMSMYDPVAVIYNYHVSTIPWANNSVIRRFKKAKHLYIQHEPHQPVPSEADAIISQNPLDPEDATHFSVPRILYEYHGPMQMPNKLIIGSFGFGLGGKGYDRLVDRVVEEFDQAEVQINIPFAHFGDAKGELARDWARRAHARAKGLVTVEVTHWWYTTEELLNWLAGHSLNAFFYDDMARGTASVLDFALSVPRPLAITGSTMFDHVWKQVPEVLVEHNSLKDIIERGIIPLREIRKQWSPSNLVKKYEEIIDIVCRQT